MSPDSSIELEFGAVDDLACRGHVKCNSPTAAVLDDRQRSSVDDVARQSGRHTPRLSVAVKRGGLLADAHDQADAVL